ncbi:Stage V sporulation protein K [Crateriforma conspicua]|uniref:Stage V sporulation protein K n=1 Tax=Crateriforma conspicua TaxID=2527996 RepID=A0A5C6FP48_9PLAN|nr:AAA family ATPase [Crateriforma conspicua]TWU63002.1 Stage V sporulation protein K [Crateriforma conspicua]
MSDPNDAIIESIRLYREALQETRTLFIESGKLIRGSYSWLGQGDGDAASIADQMDDLHQGLVMKVFATVVPDAGFQSMQQRQMGRVLLEHLWGQTVMGSKLRDAVDWLVQTAVQFQWADLVRPFAQIPSIRDRYGELESLVMRMAKLIAAVDGGIDLNEQDCIESIMRQMEISEGRTWQSTSPSEPAVEPEVNHPEDTDAAREAIDWLRREAQRLRDGAGASAGRPAEPTPMPTGGPAAASPKPAVTARTPAVDPDDDRTPEQRLDDARQKLNRLVGLDGIKDQIETLTNFLRMEKLRTEAGLPTSKPSLHMAFVGNPGTGKTTVARIVAEIYGALGVLEKGHLVETDRSGLVAEYAGQTGPKTNAKIDEALDGVLFVDEAYTLIDESGQDQYGREAVQTLLKRMEDQRERLVVILAGYPNEMNKMIRSNPGLSSRVGTTMRFEDYDPAALCRIFELIAKKSKYELTTEARRRLLRGFTYLYLKRDRHFGNGRTSRNSFERSVRRLANRLAGMTEVNRELLTTLEADDIEVAGVTQAHLAAMAAEPGKVRVTCTRCDVAMVIDDALLGTEVTCEHDPQVRFTPDFGDPVVQLPEAAASEQDATSDPSSNGNAADDGDAA